MPRPLPRDRARAPRAARALLAAGVLAICAVSAASPVRAADDPFLPQQWNVSLVGAPTAWDRATGAGTTIAIVDSGVHVDHEDLKTKLLPGRDFADDDLDPRDDHGHGTHVSGIAAAATRNGVGVAGIAPDAKLLPVRVLKKDGEQATGTVGDVIDGIRWAADQGAHVINLSLGGDVVITNLTGSPLRDAIEYAWSKGSIPVVAAGNDTSVFGSGYGTMNAVVVTATTRNDTLASYATRTGAAKWGIAAPGGAGGSDAATNIISTWWSSRNETNLYAATSGTSMAAPHVAGALALLRSRGQTPQQAVERLMATAKDLGSPGHDDTYGAGRLDIAKAVENLTRLNATTATTAAPAPATTARPAPTTTRRAGSTATTAASPTTSAAPAAPPGEETTTTTLALEIVTPDTTLPDEDAEDDEDGEGPRALGRTGGDSGDRDGLPLVPTIIAALAVLATASGTAVTALGGRRARG